MLGLARTVAFACGVALLASGRAAPAPPPTDGREWQIRPEGLGRLDLDRALYMPQARALLPEAVVTLSSSGDYVFSDKEGEELFRTSCLCSTNREGVITFHSWPPGITSEARVFVHPITTNPRYRTSRGVGVGSTVRQLIRAYARFGKPYYTYGDYQFGDATESVCFMSGDPNATPRRGTVENIRFYIRAPGGRIAGREHRGRDDRGWVDPEAVVVAVEPNTPCQTGHGDGD